MQPEEIPLTQIIETQIRLVSMSLHLVDQALDELRASEHFRIGTEPDLVRYWDTYASYMAHVRDFFQVNAELTAVQEEIHRPRTPV